MAVPNFLFADVFKRIIEVSWGEALWIVLRYDGVDSFSTFKYLPEGAEEPVDGSYSSSTPDIITLENWEPSLIQVLGRHLTTQEDWIVYKEDAEASPTITHTSYMTKEIQANVLAFNLHNLWGWTDPVDEDDPNESTTTANAKNAAMFINVGLLKGLWADIEDEAARAIIVEANKQEVRAVPDAEVTESGVPSPEELTVSANFEPHLCVIQEGARLFYTYDFGGVDTVYTGLGQAPNFEEFFPDVTDWYKKDYIADPIPFFGTKDGDTYNGSWNITWDFNKDPEAVDEEYTVTAERA